MGVAEAMNPYELFNAVSGLKVTIGEEDEVDFVTEVDKHYCINRRWGW